MKNFQTLALLLAFGLPIAVLPASAVPARNRSVALSQQSAQQAPERSNATPQSQQQPQQQEQTFTGTMVQKSGQYLFVDDASKATYKLDHQSDLSKYQLNGKRVQIEGTLDAANNVIHIARIALLRGKG